MREEGGLRKRLVSIVVQDAPEVMLYHGETVFREGVCVGDVRAGSYGHTLGGSVGLAHIVAEGENRVNKKYIQDANWEVEIAGSRYPIKVTLQPPYDPKNKKIKD